ncbi:hypothetical protein [Ekhidna sp. To15]|uniref:hypothetical protein n=1 Tax=Ekhidna sp. To15 TaxID=3395267 RepID=UPI003F5279B3
MKNSIIILFITCVSTFSCAQDINLVEIDFNKSLSLPNMDDNNQLNPLVGFLISMPEPKLWDEYLSPLKVNFWRTNEWDFELLTPLLENYPDIHLQLVLGDQYARKTYNRANEVPFEGYSTWLNNADNLLSQIPKKYYSRISIDIYNEANSERKWPNSYNNFNRFFCETISFINSKYPQLEIAGPSIAGEEAYDLIESTLKYMASWKEINQDLPLRLNQLSIHALGQSPRKCILDIPRYLSLLDEDSLGYKLGIESIIYNEYCNRNQTDYFADAIRMLEAFEMNGVKYAGRACWGTCDNGSMDNLIEFQDGNPKKKENWYGYQHYSMLDGNRFDIKSRGELSVIAGASRAGNKMCFIANHNESAQLVNLKLKNIGNYYLYKIEDSGLRLVDKTANYELKEKQVLLLSENQLN